MPRLSPDDLKKMREDAPAVKRSDHELEGPSHAKQTIVVLRNCSVVDPERIESFIVTGGYSAFERALTMTPEAIISEIKQSGLRGLEGGGFPVGVKWETCKQAAKHRAVGPILLCNANEWDPDAFIDTSIMERDPHSIIEGMLIASRAIGANEGIICIGRENKIALQRMAKAIEQANDCGLLGKNILDSGMDFDLVLIQGSGAFICLEPTALAASLDGAAAEPRARYTHPVEYGYKNRPTNLNNAETWAIVPAVINGGSQWFNSLRAQNASDDQLRGGSGTKVFSLSGAINHPGLIETPMGTTLRDIIFSIGGGIPKGHSFKAVRIGGPLGGFLPESMLDMPVDFDNLTEAGCSMGSGGIELLDNQCCAVDAARKAVSFLAERICGKCTPCREGIGTLLDALTRIATGKGAATDLDMLQETAEVMQDCSLCAVGAAAPNPVISAMRYFKSDYEAHINGRQCPSGACKK